MAPAANFLRPARWLRLTLIFLACAAVLAWPARAAVKIWDGSSSGNWSTSANWTNNAAPASGDDVIFPAASVRFTLTNNLPNLRLRSLTFNAPSNYTIYGNAITLSNGIQSLQTAGFTNRIFLNITNAGTQSINVSNSGASLELNGQIAGNGALTKTGAGHLLFGGASNNTYTGVTTVSSGVLELNDIALATQMVPGNLFIDSGATLLLTEANQIADSAQVTVNGTGFLNLNNYNETFAVLTLTNGGDVSSGFGTLTVTGRLAASAVFNGVLDPATISGVLAQGAVTRMIDVTLNTNGGPECIISANLTGSGAAGLIKAGGGTLRLSGTNTYPGLTTISNGFIHAASALAFGGSASGTDLRGGSVRLEGVVIANEGLTNHFALATLEGAAGVTSAWSGHVLLNASLTIPVFTNGVLDLGGAISGSGGVAKIQPGTLRYSGGVANSYSGNTTVSAGTLEFAKSSVGLAAISSGLLTIGDGVGGPSADVVRYFGGQLLLGVNIHINDSGLLDLNGLSDNVGGINLVGGRIDTGAGTLGLFNTVNATSSTNFPALIFGNVELNGPSRTFSVPAGGFIPDLYLGARVSNGGLSKNGGGSLMLANSNFFTGPILVTAGELRLLNDFATGTTNGGVTLVGNSTLTLEGGLAVGAESLVLNNNVPGATVLNSAADVTNSWAGDIVLQRSSRLAVNSGGYLELRGVISGAGELIKESEGVLAFSGAGANTFTNATTVERGTLLLNKSVTDGALVGPLIIGDGLGVADSEVVRYASGAGSQIANTAPVLVTVSGLLDFGGGSDSIGALSGEGHVVIDAGGNPGFGADGSSSFFDGPINGAGGFRKLGAGTLTLNGNSTNSAAVTVSAGTLLVNGIQQSSITVDTNATLGGDGIVGNITGTGGRIAPGGGVGVLSSGNVSFSGSNSVFQVELNGPAAGLQHDQLNVRGTVALGGSVLHVSPGSGFSPKEGQSFLILSNDSTDFITGTFSNQPQGSVFTVGALKFLVRYNAGTGNDVALIFTNTPLKGSAGELTGGNGDGLIQANECNHLRVALTNASGTVLSNITASLASTTTHVIVAPVLSGYADLGVNARGTNATPFQISTLPGFACGSLIQLELTVQSSGGSFVTGFTVPTSCGVGSGFCGTCPGFVTNAITTNDLANSTRLARVFDVGGTCATPLECPGEFNGASATIRYDVHSFTNVGPAACYTVYVSNPCSNLFAAAYLGRFLTNDICANYLADSGNSGAFLALSFAVPAGSNFVVVVNDLGASGAGCSYLLVVSSSECAPELQLATLPANRVRLAWPTAAAGYQLDATPNLETTNWSVVTNQPLVSGTNFLVTNSLSASNRFYRLRRPQ